MGTTRQIPPGEWTGYFEGLSRKFLAEDVIETVTVEVLSPTMGDQIEAQAVRLQGIDYDPTSRALEVWMEDLDHLAWEPTEIWVVEDDDGFPATLEIVRADGPRELLFFHRSGPPTPSYQAPAT
jgi:Family of unknown function (DUF5335)